MAFIKAKNHIFYNETIKGLLQKSGKGRFLLNFEDSNEDKLSFYQKYFLKNKHQQLFLKYLNFLQKGALEKKREEKIENKLERQIQYRMSNQFRLKLDFVEIRKVKLLEEKMLHGVFIHRDLNMPKKCYSLEINQKGEGIYRIRNKILRSEDMMKLRKIKEMYKEYETFYLDSYENFIAHESIKRQLYEVSAKITGELQFLKTKQKLNLPIDKQKPVTKHYMQLQTVVIKNHPAEYLITDMDYILKGNSHIV